MSPFSVRSLDVSTEGEKQTAITLELYVTSNGNLLIKTGAVIFFIAVMVIWVMLLAYSSGMM